ncbi:hypothetical protein [Psychrilyobacter sp. S5]|nr:hypothetical protein [Psychrilyobacter sp. S5]
MIKGIFYGKNKAKVHKIIGSLEEMKAKTGLKFLAAAVETK